MEGTRGARLIEGGRIETRQDYQHRKQRELGSRLYIAATALHEFR